MLKLQCIGHLGRDAIVNQVNGKIVINFNVAHTEKYRDAQGAEINKTTWVSCAYWSDKTAVAQYLLKGTQVYVEGIPDVKMYKDATGDTKANITLRVRNIQLLGGGNKPIQNPVQQPQNSNSYQVPSSPATDIYSADNDDLPF